MKDITPRPVLFRIRSIYWHYQIFNSDRRNLSNSKSTKEVARDIESQIYPEEPTSCCMSGCANCVWLEYAEKLSKYFKDGGENALKEINEKLTDPNMKAFLLHELRMRNIESK